MELVILALIGIIIFLIIRSHNASIQNQKEQQELVNRNKAQIDSIEREKAALQAQADKYLQEISTLNEALKESERKVDFYKNIESASVDLNVPSDTNHESNRLLDPEQAAVFDEIENSTSNFFITGKAGTGKSFLLEAFKNRTKKSFLVLAPTGIAALNVGGITLHSAFGYYNLVNLGLNDISFSTLHLKGEKQLVLKSVSTIIIDEISMVRADTLDKIDRILRLINGKDAPFGGKQLLLFGDLFQLPPIAKQKEYEFLLSRYGGVHFFLAKSYRAGDFHFREMTMNHRQKEDSEYFDLLNRVRDGSVTSEDIRTLNERVVQDYSVYDRYTALLPTKAEVEHLNQSHLRQLDGREYIYHAKIVFDKYPDKNRSLEALFPIASTLRLKTGALVMMVSNDLERKWVNGSLGIVKNLSNSSISVAIKGIVYDIPLEQFSEQEVTLKDGKLVYTDILKVLQYPIVPAYAITIHKSQGQTYKNIICDIDRCFADGQAYVALSRCASLNGLHLVRRISRSSIRVNKSVLNFYQKSLSQSSDTIPAK